MRLGGGRNTPSAHPLRWKDRVMRRVCPCKQASAPVVETSSKSRVPGALSCRVQQCQTHRRADSILLEKQAAACLKCFELVSTQKPNGPAKPTTCLGSPKLDQANASADLSRSANAEPVCQFDTPPACRKTANTSVALFAFFNQSHAHLERVALPMPRGLT